MTDTNTLAPSYAEIDAIADQHKASGHGTVWPHAFARAVLAKWGATAPASQPFAYEFSRSNGDGTHSEHIERGRLQEVAPGRWEHSGLPRGALADKPIKALYTTPQTQPAAVPAGMEPLAHVSQETFNDDGTSDIIIPALPIGMALYAAPQPAAQAQTALVIAEAALADIGDADHEPNDDLAWCEARAAQALPMVRAAIAAQQGAAA